MKQWTKEQLNETDDLTFALEILSERMNGAEPDTPFSQKLSSAYKILEELRDIHKNNQKDSLTDSIFSEKQHDYLLENIEKHLKDKCCEGGDYVEEYGLTVKQIMANKSLLSLIVCYFHKYDGEYDIWDTLEHAVSKAFEECGSNRTEVL